MYNIEDNSVISGVIPGYSKDELVTYGAYVRLVFLLDHRLQGALILEELSMQSTSQSTVTPFLRRPSEPLCRNTPLRRKSVPYSIFRSAVRRSLTRDGNKLYASMSRSHYLFCMACTRYVSLSAALPCVDPHPPRHGGQRERPLLAGLPRGPRHQRAGDERGVPKLGHAGHSRESDGDRFPDLRVRL